MKKKRIYKNTAAR